MFMKGTATFSRLNSSINIFYRGRFEAVASGYTAKDRNKFVAVTPRENLVGKNPSFILATEWSM